MLAHRIECCGVACTLRLQDEAMLAHFASCPGGMPEHSLIQWAWDNFGSTEGMFVDVGAHVGTWTVPFSGAGMPAVAFEPNPNIRSLLREGTQDATILPFALSDHFGTELLTAPGIDGGMGSIVINYAGPVRHQVEVRRLDTFGLTPTLMKVDAEGAELDVLRGGAETIDAYRPVILFECWANERGQRATALFDHFKSIDYRVELAPWPEMWVARPS